MEAVENHYSPRCVVRFRRDTHFGRVLEFSLPGTDRLIGFEHPNSFWMRQHVEAAPLTGMKGGKPGVLALERHALTRAVRDGRHVQVQDWHDP